MKKRLRFSVLVSVLAISAGCLFPGGANAQTSTTYICFYSTSTNLTPAVAATCAATAG